ncbi:DUF11 domain-containing protein [Sphaerisporangium album]|uniref:DUF11 domain-containing protein n=1 Tax=Sphaerisporangium album TaxID=509200 RepID=A0A367FBR0_9ACTN|nr:fibronectin type III domain-containing protein [Sphaerisporangium album]RCG27302.1 DUF11 domain-containing protein [Sphaerisporangium album]
MTRRNRGPARVPRRVRVSWTPRVRRGVARVALAGLLGSVLTGPVNGLTAVPANAAGSTLFAQTFKENTINADYPVSIPALPTGTTNPVCLTARGSTGSTGLRSCTSSTDAPGSGALRLTTTTTGQEGGLFGATSVPTSQGLDVTFNLYQYGGTGADGIAFVLAAVDPANPLSPANIGQSGGALGYSPARTGSNVGLANAYLGFGFDVYGNFSNSIYEGTGCTDPAYISTGGRVPGQVVVRGPGAGLVGYCAINSTATNTSSPALTLRSSGTSRSAATVPVEVAINPTATNFTTASGIAVAAGTYKVVFTPIGGTARTLQGTLPTVSSTLYPSMTWLNSSGIPRQLAFGWVGSTGSVTDFHEVDTVNVVSFSPVPDLNVTQTSYNGASPQPGDPVNYTVVASVSGTGATETSPVSITETLPTGVVPVGAFGTGWVCQAPSGQKITCTNGDTPFAAGTTLPMLEIVGIVTGGSVTPALIQGSSTATASSNDANPAIATTTTAGTPPATPSGITLSSTSGTISGGSTVTVSGGNLAGATAIEIGTTAQQKAGTPVVLLPCASGPAAGCFTVNANGTLTINSMPSRSSADTVTVTVVTHGVAGAASYVYTSAPGVPAAPTATAGVRSATVTWTAPASNGSPITSYIVTPYLNGVAQAPQTFDATTTTRTLTGLTAGASYTFTVAAVNAVGTGAAGAQSNAVVPYTVPGQPAITSVTAGDATATLTWTAPSSTGGSPITGYIVTPYIGNVAQTPQTFTGTATTQTVTGLTPGTAYTFTVTAQNIAGPGPASARSTAVTPNAAPTLTFPAPPSGEVGVAYSAPLTFTGGTGPFTWSVSAGGLPPGVTLNASTGLLSGTPTTAGTYTFTVRVTDAAGQSDARAVTLVVAPPPTLTFPAPPAGQVGVPYSAPLTFTGGTGPFTWSVSAGGLPPGVTLNASTGLLSGTPTTAGTYTFSVRITDSFNQTDTRAVTLVVGAGPLVVTKTADTTTAAPGATVHYTVTVNNTGTTAFTGVTFTDSLANVLDDATYNGDVAATTGTASFGASNVTWTGNLAGGATATITYSVTLKPLGSGDGVMTNGVTSTTLGANCPAGNTDTRCRTTVALMALTITKTASVPTATPGDTVRYTVTVTNSGQAVYPSASFSDSLAGVLDDATYNNDAAATSGTVSFTSPTLAWTGTLAVGGSVIVTYTVTVRTPDPGDRNLTNTVVSPAAGSNCSAGGADPRCTAAVTALIPQLTVTSATDVSTTVPTGVVRYTVTATNTGQTPYTDANFTFDLSGALANATYNADATATSGNLVFHPDGTVTWHGPLAIGASVTATASVTVNNPPTGGPALTSTVSSTTPGTTCPVGTGNPACSTTVTILTPQLSITATADTATATPGQTITYTVTIANTGQTPYTGASVVTSLAGVLTDADYTDNATATSGTVAYSSPNLTWAGDLPVGGTAVVTYTVTVRNPDPGDKVIVTQVSSTTLGSTCPPGGGGAGCANQVVVLVPGLTVTNTATSATAVEGATVGYTITVANTGQTPYTGITVTDVLTGLLDDATYNNNATATSGAVSYAAPNLTWTGDLPVGATATITYTVTVNSPDTGDGVLTSTVVAPAVGSYCPVGGTDPRCTTTVRLSRLLLTQAYAEPTTTPGSVIHLSATFTNTGQTPYTGISVTAGTGGTVDDAVPNGDQHADSGTLVLGATAITWTGDIPVGGVVTITGTLTVKNPDPGDKVITGTLVSSAPGNNCPSGGTDRRCTARVDVLIPALTITKTADTTTQVPGGTVGYTVTVQNTGQTPYTGATTHDDLSGLLDDAVYAGNAAASTGTVALAGQTLTWTGNLAVGATATITYSVTVRNPDPGAKLMANGIDSTDVGSTCPPNTGNPACAASVVVLTPALTIVKTADRATAVAGQTVRYRVTVTNTGQTPYTGATFADDLTGLLDDAAYGNDVTATSGTAGYTAPNVTWTGNLGVGAAATITYTVVVANPSLGDQLLASTVGSPTTGNNCLPRSGDPRCTLNIPITPTTQLTFTKTAGASSSPRGGVVAYTVTVTNSAATPYLGATFTDSLARVLDDAAYNSDAAATAGTVSYAAPVLTWTGNVPAGGTVRVTYSVTVHSAPGGDDILANTLTSTSPDGNCPAGGTDPRCAATVTVSSLTLVNTSDVPTATPGSDVRLTTTFTNTGQTPYTGISISFTAEDLLDDVTPNGDQTSTSGTISIGPSGLVWTGDIPVGATVVLSASFTVNNPDTGNRNISARSIADVPGSNCPSGSADPRCVINVPVLVPALTITKSAGATVAVPGAVVGYTIVLSNTGQTPYTGISLTDPLSGVLDDAVYDDNAAATAGAVAFAGSNLIWTGDVPVGGTVTITYSVTVLNPDPGDTFLVNTVTSAAEGSTCAPTGRTSACTTTVDVLTPALTIVKTADAATTAPGATVHYTITVTNTGQTPYPAATVTDSLAGVLDDATYGGNAAATSGTVAFTSPHLTWTGALGLGAAATITYSVTVNSPDTGDRNLVNALVSTTSGSNCAAGSADPRCGVTVPIAVLRIVMATDVSTTVPTGVVRYTATVTNDGRTPYADADFTFSLAGALDNASYNNDAIVTSGSLDFNPDGSVTWHGPLAVGESATVTASVTVDNPPGGGPTMTSTVVSTTPGNNCPVGTTDAACFTTVAILIPQLSVAVLADAATATPGGTIGYTLAITNTGQTPYTGVSVVASLAGVLTDAVYDNDAAATAGTVSYTSPNLVWTGDLNVGDTAIVTYTVTVMNPDPGDKQVVTTASSTALGSTCPPGSTGPPCVNQVIVLIPGLTITKTADTSGVVEGAGVRYTITVGNTGQTPYTGASLTDSLAGVLDDAMYDNDATATSGTVSYVAPVLTWTGDLDVGATATIRYTVTAHSPGAGDGSLTNTAVSAAAGSNCPSGGEDPRCTATTSVIALNIVLSDLTSAFTLTGPPETTVRGDGAVTMTVVTNSPTGYTVTVRPASPTLTSAGTGASIPIGDLKVRESGTGVFTPLSPDTPVLVHSQPVASAHNGDPLSNDYEVDIPFVPSGAYSATLDYVAGTQ